MSTRISNIFSRPLKLTSWLIGASTILATSFCLPSASHAFGLIFSDSFSLGGSNPINGIAVDSAGNIFVVDSDGGTRVQKFKSSGMRDNAFGDSGNFFASSESIPTGIAIDSFGHLVFPDISVFPEPDTNLNVNQIQKITGAGISVSPFPSTTSTALNAPTSIAVDKKDNINSIFIVDTNSIQKFNSAGSSQSTFITLSFTPNGIAIDSDGNVFVTNPNNNVQKFKSDGTPSLTFGNLTIAPDNVNGLFNNPTGIAVDNLGNIFVADTGNNRVQAFRSDGVYLAQVGTLGTGNGQFDTANPLAVNGSTLYVADATNRVQTFTIDPAAVPFEFSPNLGIGALGIVVAAKKLQRKTNQQEQPKEKQKVE